VACIFCEIVAGRVPSQSVYHSEDVTAFRDIDPKAPTHILIVPNRHIAFLADVKSSDGELLARIVEVANDLARQEGIAQSGYRLVVNSGPDAGQTVAHLHVHLLGGRPMTWPPG